MKQKHSVTSEKTNITFNSGDLAGLASGSVTMELGETNVFVSVTAASKLRPDQNWFPLKLLKKCKKMAQVLLVLQLGWT